MKASPLFSPYQTPYHAHMRIPRLPKSLKSLLYLMGINHLYQLFHNTPLARKWFMPGKRVDVGGYNIHYHMTGPVQSTETPTVILEAGMGGSTPYWTAVAPIVAKFAPVVSYDRAGYGWSDNRTEVCSIECLVEELHTLLKEANIQPPYILVGHSFGGVVNRLFTQKYPDEVAGVILVDSATVWKGKKGFEKHNRKARVRNTLLKMGFPLWIAQLNLLHPMMLKPLKDIPWRTKLALFNMFFLRKSARTYLTELSIVADCVEAAEKESSLGDKPLIVIRHGKEVSDTAPEMLKETEKMMIEAQERLMKLSSNSRMMVAKKSGHQVIMDQPEVVVQAIREMQKFLLEGWTPPKPAKKPADSENTSLQTS